MRTNLLIALLAVAVFQLVAVTSGKVAVGDGLGWDGRAYARMTTEGIRAGSGNTQARPLVVWAARVPYALGAGVIKSFEMLNAVAAFTLYLFVALLLDREKVGVRLRAVIVVNLALCIATSKMFGFYPVQVDLGALAVITAAFYFVYSGRRFAGAIGCVLAAASREFGITLVCFGIHRAVRQRRWRDILLYLPAVATTVLVRVLVRTPPSATAQQLSVTDAITNLQLWASPPFVAVFFYFAIVVFGGVSLLLLLRPAALGRSLRAQPELATFLLIVGGLSAAGSFDVWRYLVFALPAVVVLAGRATVGLDERSRLTLGVCMTVVTVLTQQPFALMDESSYFREWFPLYLVLQGSAVPGLAAEWLVRAAVLFLVIAGAAWELRRRPSVGTHPL
jgi:hypothetical protein